MFFKFILGFLNFGVVAFLALLAAPAQSAPRTPTQDNIVIERLPFRAGDSRAKALAQMRAKVLQAPTDAAASVTLAQAYFDLALAQGDPRYVGYADAIVARFDTPLTPDLLITRGMLRQYRHDFAGALADFASALTLDPDRAGAHAWRGAIYLVQAQYANARLECAALLQLQRTVLHGGCAGLAQAYNGQLADGYATLQQALSTTQDDDNRRWLLTRLGEVAAWRGQTANAERHYRDAVALGQDDGYLLAAWADFLLDNARPAEVVKLLASWEASDGLLLRLTEAEALLQLPAATAHIQALDDRFAAAKLRGDTTHRAEEARFQLRLRKSPALSLQLAAANYQVQKEPRDARILLESALAVQISKGTNTASSANSANTANTADAANATDVAKDAKDANDVNNAKAARDWLQSSGFEDARLRSLAAQILQKSQAPQTPQSPQSPTSLKKAESKP